MWNGIKTETGKLFCIQFVKLKTIIGIKDWSWFFVLLSFSIMTEIVLKGAIDYYLWN